MISSIISVLYISPLLIVANSLEGLKSDSYTNIEQNRLHVQFKKRLNSFDKCGCCIGDALPCTKENGCINAYSSIECLQELCPAKERCLNQNFQRGVKFSLKIRKTQKNGHGLFAGEDIPANQFIIEYLGEVIGNAQFKKRYEQTTDGKYYFLDLGHNTIIDAKNYGNESRFANHSCEPNAVADKWIVYTQDEEHVRVGLFSLRDISKVNIVYYIEQ